MEKCLSNRLRMKIFEKGADLTLEQLQTIARAMEASTAESESIGGSKTTPEEKRVQH